MRVQKDGGPVCVTRMCACEGEGETIQCLGTMTYVRGVCYSEGCAVSGKARCPEADVVTWSREEERVPEGGRVQKMDRFHQGGRFQNTEGVQERCEGTESRKSVLKMRHVP